MSQNTPSTPPLAEILRPESFDDFAGQVHLAGAGSTFRKMVESGNLHSMIFWGPPGVGKTTLAFIIANQLNKPFHILSAISSGVKDIRNIIDQATQSGAGPHAIKVFQTPVLYTERCKCRSKGCTISDRKSCRY